MKNPVGISTVLIAVLLILSSCTLAKRYAQLSPGELRFVKLQLPDIIHENLPYQAVLSFEGDGEPRIRKVCYRWLAESASGTAPRDYWDTYSAQSNRPDTAFSPRWRAEGRFSDTSPFFCVDVDSIKYESPSTLLVRFTARDIKPSFSRMEFYAEYSQNGEVKETNRVSGRFFVEQ